MKLLGKLHPVYILFNLIFIVFFPILFLSKLFPGFDLLLVFYPYSFHFLNSQNFWFSGILSGFNIGATPSGFAGNWIYYFLANLIGSGLFNFIAFYNAIILFYFVLTAIFSYLASCKLGFDKYVSVLITSIYIFSAYNLSWMVNIVTAPSLFIFPAIIYFLIKFRENFNWFWPIAGGIILGLSLIVSHPQFALIGIFGGFLFPLFLTWENKEYKWRLMSAFIAIVLIGLVISAFQLISEYQASQLAQRGMALSFAQSQECSLGIFDFVRYILPNFNFGVNCESLLYVGILPLILAIFAVFYVKSDRKRILFWTSVSIFTILFGVKYSPLSWIFHQLPVWNSLRGPARFIMLGNFALAVLSGYGFNWILSTYGRSPEGRENKENFKELKFFRWIRNIFFWFLLIVAGINIVGLFKNTLIKLAENYFDKYYYQKTIGLPLENYHRSIENLISNNFYTFSFLNKNFLIPFVLTVAAFLVFIFIHKFSKKTLFYTFLFSGFIWAIFSPMVSSGLNRDFFKETPVIEFLKNQEKPFRIYSLMPNLSTYQLVVLNHGGTTEDDQNEFLKMMLPPNLNTIYGLDSIDGYDVSMPRRTAKILSELLSERATLGNKIAEARLKPEEKIKIFESRVNLLKMMNVRYVISAYPLDEKIFKKVFEIKATRFEIPVYVYENNNVLPILYFSKFVSSIEPDDIKVPERMLAPSIDFSNFSFIECGGNCDGASSGKIIDFKYDNGYLQLNAESQTGGWLIFSESFDRGWQAKINDSIVPIYRANYIYQAIRVPKGKNIVEFGYK